MRMKLVTLTFSLWALSGCGAQHHATLVHPQTNAKVECSASGRGFVDRMTATADFDNCVKKYEAQGYVRQGDG